MCAGVRWGGLGWGHIPTDPKAAQDIRVSFYTPCLHWARLGHGKILMLQHFNFYNGYTRQSCVPHALGGEPPTHWCIGQVSPNSWTYSMLCLMCFRVVFYLGSRFRRNWLFGSYMEVRIATNKNSINALHPFSKGLEILVWIHVGFKPASLLRAILCYKPRKWGHSITWKHFHRILRQSSLCKQ